MQKQCFFAKYIAGEAERASTWEGDEDEEEGGGLVVPTFFWMARRSHHLRLFACVLRAEPHAWREDWGLYYRNVSGSRSPATR